MEPCPREGADADQRVYFELLHEPQPPLDNARLTALYNEVIPIIGRTNPTRPVIVDTEKGSTSYNQETFRMPDDPYATPAVHPCEPNSFTFQYDPYSASVRCRRASHSAARRTSPSSRQRGRIAAFLKVSGTVPFVGEFGAYQDIPLAQRINLSRRGDEQLRLARHRFVRLGLFERLTLRDDNGWLPGIVESLAKPLD